MSRLRVAEEVFIAVRELAMGAGRNYARWREFRRAWEVMSQAGFSGINITLSDFLRAQVHHKTLLRPSRGMYVFNANRPKSPFYLKPHNPAFNNILAIDSAVRKARR